MKNKTKIWLAFLLPLSAISIVTPMVLSSCSNSEQAPPITPENPSPNLPGGGETDDPTKPPGGDETDKPTNPPKPPGGGEDIIPQIPLQPAKIKIKQFNATNHIKQELSNKYILAELIREFVTLPKGTNISQMLEEKEGNNLWFPASTSFHNELTKGFLFDFIKTNIYLRI